MSLVFQSANSYQVWTSVSTEFHKHETTLLLMISTMANWTALPYYQRLFQNTSGSPIGTGSFGDHIRKPRTGYIRMEILRYGCTVRGKRVGREVSRSRRAETMKTWLSICFQVDKIPCFDMDLLAVRIELLYNLGQFAATETRVQLKVEHVTPKMLWYVPIDILRKMHFLNSPIGSPVYTPAKVALNHWDTTVAILSWVKCI